MKSLINKKNRNKTRKNRNKSKSINIQKNIIILGGTKKNKFIKLSCSPENDKDKKSFTCYSNDDLNKLKEIWNARHPDNIINSNEPKEIWNNLKLYYSKSCNKESCWAKKLIKDYSLNDQSKILDIGCGKGFLLYEIKKIIKNIKIYGLDISKYAKDNAKIRIKNISYFFILFLRNY